MPVRGYPNRLVIGRDHATGFHRVGWLTEMLEDRFDQIEVICDTDNSSPITPKSPYYDRYQSACDQARALNVPLLSEQRRNYLSQGWYPVQLDPDQSHANVDPDVFGSYLESATNAHFRLCANGPAVWALINQGVATRAICQHPKREMDELEFQVWCTRSIDKLSQHPGEILEGELVATETGLWFRQIRQSEE